MWSVGSLSPAVVVVVQFDRLVVVVVVMVMRFVSVSGAESGVLLRSAASR